MEVHIGGNSAPAEEAGSLPAIDWNCNFSLSHT